MFYLYPNKSPGINKGNIILLMFNSGKIDNKITQYEKSMSTFLSTIEVVILACHRIAWRFSKTVSGIVIAIVNWKYNMKVY